MTVDSLVFSSAMGTPASAAAGRKLMKASSVRNQETPARQPSNASHGRYSMV